MNNVNGVPLLHLPSEEIFQCTACIQSKTKRAQIASPVGRITQLLELTHTDMTGKINKRSHGGALYLVVFLDHCTSMSAFYFINNKFQYQQCLRAYKNLAENEAQQPPRMYALRLDKAGEQSSNKFCNFICENGMKIEYIPAYGSQSKGVAERLIQKFWTMVRTMLLDSELPKSYGRNPSLTKIICETDYHQKVLKWKFLTNYGSIKKLTNQLPSHLDRKSIHSNTDRTMRKTKQLHKERYLDTSLA